MTDALVERDRTVETSDGVGLATDVYRPDDDGEHPTLVHRNPYDKSNAKSVGGLIFNPLDAVDAGFAVVVQDVRGRFGSGGEWKPFRNEASDGYDAVEWAAAQPWSSGRVGTYGSSYHGITTLQTVAADPPHLEAAFAYSTAGSFHDGYTYDGGAFNLGFNFYWVLGLVGDTLDRVDVDDATRAALTEAMADPETAVERRPLDEMPGFDDAIPYWSTWLDHPTPDAYWRDVDVVDRIADGSCPILHLSGWYDTLLPAHLRLYEAVERRRADRESTRQRFVLGPWTHEAYTSPAPTRIGDRNFGPDAATGPALMSDLALEWFETWLTDDAPVEIDGPSVEYFQMGTDEWRTAERWPPAHEETPYYLRSGGDARSADGGALATTPPDGPEPADGYTFDPDDPVPTRGGRVYMPTLCSGGVRDQSPAHDREDVLVYLTPPLDTPVSVTGPVGCDLYVSCSSPDADLVATLLDVDPSGYRANVAEGIQRARYRDEDATDRDATFFEPDAVERVCVDMAALAHTFEAGHRIGLSVTSSNFPKYDRNPGARTTPSAAGPDDFETTTVRIHHTADHPSNVVLSVPTS